MEEIIHKEQFIDDEDNVFFEFDTCLGASFTEEELQLLEAALCKYDVENIYKFINLIQTTCRFKYNCVNDKNSNFDIKKNRKDVIKVLNNAKNKLDSMTFPRHRFGKYKLEVTDNIIPNMKLNPYPEFIDPEWNDDFVSIKKKAESLVKNIDSFLSEFTKFDERLNKVYSKGRKQADYDGFYRQIAEAYLLYIGKPTTQKDGEFAHVMRILSKAVGMQTEDTKAVGMPTEDPSRGVRQALKKI